MHLLASFALGGFNPWAAGFGIGSLVLFGLVGLVGIVGLGEEINWMA